MTMETDFSALKCKFNIDSLQGVIKSFYRWDRGLHRKQPDMHEKVIVFVLIGE